MHLYMIRTEKIKPQKRFLKQEAGLQSQAGLLLLVQEMASVYKAGTYVWEASSRDFEWM